MAVLVFPALLCLVRRALLLGRRVLTKPDHNALARYCQTYIRWQKAEQFIQQYGESFPLKSGNGIVKGFMPFPQAAAATKLAAVLTKLEGELEVVPSSKLRIDVVSPSFR